MHRVYISLLAVGLIVGSYFIFMKNDNTSDQQENVAEQSTSNIENTGSVSVAPTPNAKTLATIRTNLGTVELELATADTTQTVANFTKLAEGGFYDGTRFHRVISGFMIQGGDPLSKDTALKNRWGTGGPGYTFPDEIHQNNHNGVGTIAMANAGPNTNGSQFFINTADNGFLDAKHTVFGKVVSGMDVLRLIERVPTEGPDRPVNDVIIKTITVVRK